MLPSNLLITRRWRNKIRPVFARPNPENLGVARLLTCTYMDHVGRMVGELNEVLKDLEDLDYDYRYVRGLSTLLNRRCQLQSRATTDPIKARRQIFKIAHEDGLPTTQEARRLVLEKAALKLGVTVDELEVSLFGDLEHELLLKGFEPIEPEVLVKQYNLSLTQTLLFYSTELTFTVMENWQRIFRQIKWLGLIYTIWRSAVGYLVKVDGPISLFKLNRRYGTSLAKLLPLIIQSRRWSIKAKIFRSKGERLLLDLELNNKKHGEYMTPIEKPIDTEFYDSGVEKDFAGRFNALGTDWIVTREPEPIPVGKQVMIPDFGFQKAGIKVYMEVVGFWTPRYLQEKIKKLRLLHDVDMIVAVDRTLACHSMNQVKLNVIYYNRRVPLRPVLAHLKAREEILVKQQTRRIRDESLIIQEPVVEIRELAEKMGVLEGAVKSFLSTKGFPGYVRLGDMFIKGSKLKEIQDKLQERLNNGVLYLGEATRIIEDAGGRKSTSVLDVLGYKIEWHGIDPKSAKIRRKT